MTLAPKSSQGYNQPIPNSQQTTVYESPYFSETQDTQLMILGSAPGNPEDPTTFRGAAHSRCYIVSRIKVRKLWNESLLRILSFWFNHVVRYSVEV